MNEILIKQIIEDYSCSKNDVIDDLNHFTVFKVNDGRRKYDHIDECFLRMIVINSKLIFSGKKEVIALVKEKYKDAEGQWILEPENLASLNEILHRFGYRISMIHPFFISETKSDIDSRYEIEVLNKEQIKQYLDDERFDEAFDSNINCINVLGCMLKHDGEIIGMSGASIDSPYMMQIGVNVVDKYKNNGFGSVLVSKIKNEIIDMGYLPYYQTSFSHISSQKVATNAGFKLAFIELFTIPNNL